MGHVARERKTMAVMVDMYCHDHHGTVGALCDECSIFLDYADVRLDKCPYGEKKPTCSNCPVHCYKPHYRARAKLIMRYAGPRMLMRHPWLAITHMVDGLRKAIHPRELTRERRLESRER
jgi:hypothetical protein